MKRFLTLCRKALPHLNLILSLMILTFFGIDRVNPSMYFLENEMTKWIAAGLALFTLVQSVILIVKETKNQSPKE